MLDGILRGHHHERLGQRIGAVVHRHLIFIHRFQQRALGFGRGAVDFVRQDDVGKDGARAEFEALGGLAENADARSRRKAACRR